MIKKFTHLIKNQFETIPAEREIFFHGNKKLIYDPAYSMLFAKTRGLGYTVEYYFSEEDILQLDCCGLKVLVNRDFAMFKEVIVNQIYTLPSQYLSSPYCVFDVGMNRGYASLYFANQPNCVKVFGYEIDSSTFDWAKRNVEINPSISPKIEIFPVGWWNEDAEISISMSEHDSATHIVNNNTEKTKVANVIKASKEVSSKLSDLPSGTNKILKIDIEGAEYVVFEDLYSHNLITEFDIIIGETHAGPLPDTYFSDFKCIYSHTTGKNQTEFCYKHL